LYNILEELSVHMRLIRLIKIWLSETYIKIRTGNLLSNAFRIQNDLRQGDALPPFLFKFVLEYSTMRS
jgi:hypothetical protein